MSPVRHSLSQVELKKTAGLNAAPPSSSDADVAALKEEIDRLKEKNNVSGSSSYTADYGSTAGSAHAQP